MLQLYLTRSNKHSEWIWIFGVNSGSRRNCISGWRVGIFVDCFVNENFIFERMQNFFEASVRPRYFHPSRLYCYCITTPNSYVISNESLTIFDALYFPNQMIYFPFTCCLFSLCSPFRSASDRPTELYVSLKNGQMSRYELFTLFLCVCVCWFLLSLSRSLRNCYSFVAHFSRAKMYPPHICMRWISVAYPWTSKRNLMCTRSKYRIVCNVEACLGVNDKFLFPIWFSVPSSYKIQQFNINSEKRVTTEPTKQKFNSCHALVLLLLCCLVYLMNLCGSKWSNWTIAIWLCDVRRRWQQQQQQQLYAVLTSVWNITLIRNAALFSTWAGSFICFCNLSNTFFFWIGNYSCCAYFKMPCTLYMNRFVLIFIHAESFKVSAV